METAGATVLLYEEFGSYQGDWWAKVEYNGEVRWVHGAYGSCSVCDAFQSEFTDRYHKHLHSNNSYYDSLYDGFDPGCEKCNAMKEQLIAFGKQYLDNNWHTQEEAEKATAQSALWLDESEKTMADFIKNNRI